MSDGTVTLVVDGTTIAARTGDSLAVALLNAGINHVRRSAIGEPRAPLCGMGVCFECRVTVDGEPHVRSCLVPVVDGMAVSTRG